MPQQAWVTVKGRNHTLSRDWGKTNIPNTELLLFHLKPTPVSASVDGTLFQLLKKTKNWGVILVSFLAVGSHSMNPPRNPIGSTFKQNLTTFQHYPLTSLVCATIMSSLDYCNSLQMDSLLLSSTNPHLWTVYS